MNSFDKKFSKEFMQDLWEIISFCRAAGSDSCFISGESEGKRLEITLQFKIKDLEDGKAK